MAEFKQFAADDPNMKMKAMITIIRQFGDDLIEAIEGRGTGEVLTDKLSGQLAENLPHDGPNIPLPGTGRDCVLFCAVLTRSAILSFHFPPRVIRLTNARLLRPADD